MRPSIRLGTLFGIPIGLHWSVAVIVGLITLGVSGTFLPSAAAGFGSTAYLVAGLVVSIGLLASIVAHELGHALVARNNGVGTRAINLFALGGVAELESEADNPGAAARIALAGPAVSVGLGVAGFVGAFLASTLGLSSLAVASLSIFGLINLGMAVFNMIPALPLDGGRVLQAALWKRRGDREEATLTAAGVGRYLGWALVAFGAWQLFTTGSGLWTMVIGWFVVSAARAEAMRAQFRIMSRSWAPPQWWQWRPGGPGPGGPGHAGPAGPTGPPPAAGPLGPAPSGPVIDVDGRPVAPRTEHAQPVS